MLFSKTDERSMKSETNLISCDVPPENPKDHEDTSAGKQYVLCSIAFFKIGSMKGISTACLKKQKEYAH